jgi:hypothetical protein
VKRSLGSSSNEIFSVISVSIVVYMESLGTLPMRRAHTVQWRGMAVELPVVTCNDYVSIARHCCELSSDKHR